MLVYYHLLVLYFLSRALRTLCCGRLSTRPYRANVSSRYEWLAIQEGRRSVLAAVQRFPERKQLLCSIFVNASNELAKDNLFRNMRLSSPHCDWAVVVYGGSKRQLCRDDSFARGLVHCDDSRALTRFPSLYRQLRHIPKPLLYFDLLPHLREYQYVLLMDEDISLEGFSFPIYEEIFHCSFHPLPPPLISQGLVHEESQDYLFLRPSSWQDTNVLASESVFVEQQIPFFHSVFFQWFVEFVLQRAVPKIIETGSTWGSDTTWCGAAFMFAKEILRYDMDQYIPCALIIGAPHYHHLDFRTIAPKRSNWTEFLARGDSMLEYFHSLYPGWNTFLFTRINETIPSHPDTILKQIKELPEECPFHDKPDYYQRTRRDKDGDNIADQYDRRDRNGFPHERKHPSSATNEHEERIIKTRRRTRRRPNKRIEIDSAKDPKKN